MLIAEYRQKKRLQKNKNRSNGSSFNFPIILTFFALLLVFGIARQFDQSASILLLFASWFLVGLALILSLRMVWVELRKMLNLERKAR